MALRTNIFDSPLVRQAPIAGLFALSAVLSLALPVLDVTNTASFSASFVVVAAATAFAWITVASPRTARFAGLVPAVDFIAIALLRTGTGSGTSVFTSLTVLPVVWFAAREGKHNIAYALLGTALVILAPFVLEPGDPLHLAELIRLLVSLIVFASVAVVVHALSDQARSKVRRAEESEGRMVEEIDRAAAVQRSLLPGTSFAASGMTVAGECLPAKTVGGDFFDWYSTEAGLAITVGDVMGKGVGAGLIAAAVRASVRSAHAVDDPSEALRRASDGLTVELAGADVTFTTLFHARISHDGVLQWADAGHGLSLIVRRNGTMERLATRDLPLGLGVTDEWGTSTTVLDQGDMLISISDGVLDLFDGGLDTVEQVAAITRRSGSPAAAVRALTERASDIAHEDDVTVVILQRDEVAPPPHGREAGRAPRRLPG